MLGKSLCGECVHNTYIRMYVHVCIHGILYVCMHICMYSTLVLCLHLCLCDFLVVNSCQTHKGETTLKGFVVTSTYSRAAVAAHSVSGREIFRISYRFAIIIQCVYVCMYHILRAEVLSLHQAHQGDTVSVTAEAAAVEIVNGNFV